MPKRRGKPTLPGDERKRVAEAIDYLVRVRFGDNESALARALGVSQPAVSQWRSDKNAPTLASVRAIATLIPGVNEYDLLSKGLPEELRVELAAKVRASAEQERTPAVIAAADTLAKTYGKSREYVLAMFERPALREPGSVVSQHAAEVNANEKERKEAVRKRRAAREQNTVTHQAEVERTQEFKAKKRSRKKSA